ncbi:MAG TPA: TIGR02466 family protein [Polyangiaceae bacterium]|nr:TIGR02466 family protein [Polyangiaceae bacterium]
MTIRVKKEFTFVFPTLILERHLEDVAELNQRLARLILQREAAGGGVVKSNVGGWHSATDFWRWSEREPAQLFERVAGAVKDYVAVERRVDAAALDLVVSAEGWANVARAGNYSKPHVHPNANISGVYYVASGDDAPEHPQSGVIEFIDPRQRPGMFETEGTLSSDGYRIVPKSGLLLLFPAWLYHYVHPYVGTQPRLCVAFNVTIQKLKQLSPP